jgi:hypothetical protein
VSKQSRRGFLGVVAGSLVVVGVPLGWLMGRKAKASPVVSAKTRAALAEMRAAFKAAWKPAEMVEGSLGERGQIIVRATGAVYDSHCWENAEWAEKRPRCAVEISCLGDRVPAVPVGFKRLGSFAWFPSDGRPVIMWQVSDEEILSS